MKLQTNKNKAIQQTIIQLSVDKLHLHTFKVGKNETKENISKKILHDFYSCKRIKSKVSSTVINIFVNDFFEELPPGNLEIPFSVIDEWYSRIQFSLAILDREAITA